MKIIVGLGNPGKEYAKTRHNTGFLVMDEILKKLNIELDKEKYEALYTIYKYQNEKIYFVKPMTYMNNSGKAVKALMNYYKLNVDDLLVIYDDLDLPVGKIRLRESGSCGGQNGMRSIIDLLGNQNIKRIRVGIGKDPLIPTVDYVLGKVSPSDKKEYKKALDKASEAVIYYLDNDFNKTMSIHSLHEIPCIHKTWKTTKQSK